MTRRPTPLARRLLAVEKRSDGRRLMHAHRLTDGRTVRLSTLDVLGAVHDGFALHGEHVTEPPPGIVRTLALLDPDDDTSVWGRTVRGVAAEWCAAYDGHRPMALYVADDDPAPEGADG
ncbi:hypothetical protein [Streptomyces albus]|uniref:hypothetical protein n=1 Tax=unclassified Streptomyces TaxID=2593676 RepID=UPI0004BD2C0D|nr:MULTISPECIES: hypothetical protein [unclassified Streptomyces]KPC91907.1 hypothetical protein ADL27_27295 [Streptomyces sp. NRRL F-6602]